MPVGMQAIIPKSFLADLKKLDRVVENALTGLAEDVAADFETTVETWNSKPEFAIAKRKGERIISTKNFIYGLLNKGTKPHIIVPRRGKVLTFLAGGRPKSRVRVIGSNSGGAGNTIVYTKRVQHPGTAPREWDKAIAEKWEKRAPQVLQRSIDAAVR